jgi:transglutaminase-like putative cysteine protease
MPETRFPQPRTIRPIGAYQLSGLVAKSDRLLTVDTVRGYLLAVDPGNDNTTIINPYHLADWTGVTGLTIWQDCLWFARGQDVWWCEKDTLTPHLFTHLPYPVNGVAVWQDIVYVSCQKSGYIQSFDRHTSKLIGKIPQPGVGSETLTVWQQQLWVCDRTEQTVYCLDPLSGEVQLSVITPYPSPTGIAFYESADLDARCYVAYADEEPYIRDNPNARFPYQLTFRDRTFIHPLHIQNFAADRYTLSNGYLVELSYVEELLPLEAVTLDRVEWRIALPSNTLRQRIRYVEPIGREFTIEEQNGQKVAVFEFERLQPHQGGLLGWKVILEMYSLKYHLSPTDVDDSLELPPALHDYLIDDDDLAMDTPIVQQAARESCGTETNVLRKMLKIRNYVYDRLSYGIRPYIDPPDLVLSRGIGSCGEYVGVLLALARLNGIACRTIGRYKCPPFPDRRGVPLEPDFNHVWLEFYVPGIGWLPMESNVDDTVERGPYPERFFMGLAWYHTEIGKGITFEKANAAGDSSSLSIGDLAINHIRFRILEELIPPG